MSGPVIEAGVIEAILRARDEMTPVINRAVAGLRTTGDSVKGIGMALAPVSAVLSAAGGAAIMFANNMNKGMANVASLIPGNIERVQELKASVQDMAIEVGKSTGDLTDGLYQTISAFGDTADTVAILELNARSATAGLASTTDAINLTSAVTKAYNDTTAGAVEKASDLALMTVRLGQTTFPELAASIGRVTPLTAALNISQEELFATMATFTGVTGGAAEVSTQLRGVLQSLMAPTDDMTALFSELGVESGKALIEQRGLQGALDAIVAKADATKQPLQEYLASIEGQTLALAATGGQAQAYTDKIAAMKEAAGTTTEAFNEQTKGVNKAGFQWDQFRAKMQVMAERVGDLLLPTFERLTRWAETGLGWVEDAVEWFSKLPTPIQDAAIAVGAIVAIGAPTLIGIGAGMNAVATGITAISTASSTGSLAVGKFFGFLSGPAALALATIGTGFVIAKSDMEAYQREQERLAAVAQDGTLNLTEYGRSLNTIPPAAVASLNALAALGTQAGQTNTALGTMSGGIKKLSEDAQKLRDGLLNTDAKQRMADLVAAVQSLSPEQRAAAITSGTMKNALDSLTASGLKLHPVLAQLAVETHKMTLPGVNVGDGVLAWFNSVQVRADNLVGKIISTTQSVRELINVVPSIPLSLPPLKMSQVSLKDIDLKGINPLAQSFINWQNSVSVGRAVTSAGTKTGEEFRSSLAKSLDGLGSVVVGAFQGGGNVGAAVGASVVGGLGQDLGAAITKRISGQLGKTLGGVIGPLGSMLGGWLGGKLGGLFGKSEGRKELEAYNEKIADMRSSLLDTYGSFERIAQLDKILGTDVAAGWAHQGKAGFEAWGKSADALREKLAKVYAEFDNIARSGGVLSGEALAFRDASADDAQVQSFVLGQVTAAGDYVTEFLNTATLKTAEGASAMASVMLAAWDGSAAGLRDLAPTLDAYVAQVTALRDAAREAGRDETAFNAALTAVDSVRALAEIATNEVTGPMVSGIQAATDALVAMHNSGFLTQETFAGLVTEIEAQRDAILATGATSESVNGVMQRDLQRLWELVQTGTYAVDDQTAAWLKNAEESGLVGDRFRSSTDQMVVQLTRIADMFETVFADKLTDAATRGAEAAGRALRDGIPTTLDFTVRPQVIRPGTTDAVDPSELPGFASGTRGQYVNFGSESLVRLHGWERISTPGEDVGGRPVINITGNEFNVRDDSDIDRIASAIVARFYERGLVNG